MDMFPFVAGSYESRSKKFDCQRTVNLYPEASGSGNSKSIAMLIGTPGTVQWGGGGESVPGGSETRGAIRFSGDVMIAVLGPRVIKFDQSGIGVDIGSISTVNGIVSMASNGIVIMLVTGGPDGYFIDPIANTVTLITDPDFIGADRVDFIDGYFVFNKLGTQQYQIAGPYTTAIDPLDFASAEGAPDLLVSLIVANKEIILLGETSTEFHVNSGNVDFPFEPVQGAFIGMGIAARHSIAKITDTNGQSIVCWLTTNESGQGQVVRTIGYQPQRISDHAIEYQIATYSRIDDAIAYTYQQEGHQFYVLIFPTANKTWCYDFTTELWHERMSTTISLSTDGSCTWTNHRHLSNCHVFFAGKNLVGDYANGLLLYFDLNVYTDRLANPSINPDPFTIGSPIFAIRQCPHLAANDAWMIFDELWIDMQTGVGLNEDRQLNGTGVLYPSLIGKDPKLLLEWSDDGGDSFPNLREIPMGKMGQRMTRVLARRLGKSKDRVFRATVIDPVRRCFIAAGTRTRIGAR